jgi:hypothetical protein
VVAPRICDQFLNEFHLVIKFGHPLQEVGARPPNVGVWPSLRSPPGDTLDAAHVAETVLVAAMKLAHLPQRR